jgi:hypothetical protein
MFGLTNCKFTRLDLCVLFRLYLKLQVDFFCDFSWDKNLTSQDFYSYLVGSVNHLGEIEQHV